ncbi:Hypothetical predicted protein [Octopus vulgaris]|uniref:Uncharacterized protein n=1 Tax=Octopus vulgaris TaxID=6645 RepID=A0AA36F3J9_OCTVU|nr:Hypothetical predicted protein [Octopus vulgaris]
MGRVNLAVKMRWRVIVAEDRELIVVAVGGRGEGEQEKNSGGDGSDGGDDARDGGGGATNKRCGITKGQQREQARSLPDRFSHHTAKCQSVESL